MGKATPPKAEYMKSNEMIRKQHDISTTFEQVYTDNVDAAVKYRDWYRRQRDKMDKKTPENIELQTIEKEIAELEAELQDDAEFENKLDQLAPVVEESTLEGD